MNEEGKGGKLRWLLGEKGASIGEYVILAALVAAVIGGALTFVGRGKYREIEIKQVTSTELVKMIQDAGLTYETVRDWMQEVRKNQEGIATEKGFSVAIDILQSDYVKLSVMIKEEEDAYSILLLESFDQRNRRQAEQELVILNKNKTIEIRTGFFNLSPALQVKTVNVIQKIVLSPPNKTGASPLTLEDVKEEIEEIKNLLSSLKKISEPFDNFILSYPFEKGYDVATLAGMIKSDLDGIKNLTDLKEWIRLRMTEELPYMNTFSKIEFLIGRWEFRKPGATADKKRKAELLLEQLGKTGRQLMKKLRISSPLTPEKKKIVEKELEELKTFLKEKIKTIDRVFVSVARTGVYNSSLPLRNTMVEKLESVSTISDLSKWKPEWQQYVEYIVSTKSVPLSSYKNDTHSRMNRIRVVITEIEEKIKTSSALSIQPITSEQNQTGVVGGISLIEIDEHIQYDGSFKGIDLSLPLLSKQELEGLDLEKEEEIVRNYLATGYNPHGDRLKRLLAGLFQKDKFTTRQLDLLRLSQELCNFLSARGLDTTPDQRAFILITETGFFLRQGVGKAAIKPSLN